MLAWTQLFNENRVNQEILLGPFIDIIYMAGKFQRATLRL